MAHHVKAIHSDYSREVDLVRRLSRAARTIELGAMVAAPFVAVSSIFWERGETLAAGLSTIRNSLDSANRIALTTWGLRYGGDRGTAQRSPAVRALVDFGESIGTLNGYGTDLHYVNVAGIPVAREPYPLSLFFYSPASADEIIASVRALGARWVIDTEGGVHRDDSPVPEVFAAQTVEIIERIRPHTTCRAWVLWGPPRGGKSVAARQIATALTGGWVRICGASARSEQAWQAVRALGAEAVILDDLDVNAGQEDALLGLLEQARMHCRVIVSTMNVLPRRDSEDKKHELRGAILAPGRAADESPREYAVLDDAVREALAPSINADLRAPDLLAAYLAELELRHRAHGRATPADLAEMRERMAAVGDR